MTVSPSVSVVVPNYNHTRYLAGALTSALSQVPPPLEVIVVDDGSTDGCREVVSTFGDRVRYVHQHNQGLAAARNTGIRQARGEFVGLLDADDLWLPGFLDAFSHLAGRLPAATVYYCGARAVDEQGAPLPGSFGGPPVEPAALRARLVRANFLIPSTIVMRRTAIVDAGLFDASLRSCEDWDLWLRLLPNHQFVGSASELVHYRQHPHSLSTDVEGMRRAALTVVRKHFGPDEGDSADWPAEKRRAYGGLYSYFALLSVQRASDWDAGARHVAMAFRADPATALDLDFFYALGHGTQPAALRGSNQGLDLPGNAAHVGDLIRRACTLPGLSRDAEATASHALGLLAYNARHFAMSRRFLVRAARLRPALWRDRVVAGNVVKSFVAPLVRPASRLASPRHGAAGAGETGPRLRPGRS